MTFETSLKETAQAVDTLLDELMPLDGPARRVVEAMRYSSLAQGKRLRPFFVLESSRLFDVAEESALRTGAALECVHCYSLVHDDLPAMDDDDLRRGKPTCHIAFDEATAILAGDGLLTFAFEILSDPLTHENTEVRLQLVSALAQAAGKDGMVGGQMLDLLAEKQDGQTLEDIMLIQSLKTGALFGFSLEAGALLAEADGADLQLLRTYADRVGLAFQIADDILDVESTPDQLGKQTQKDAHAGKATFIDLFGLDGAKAKANELVEEAVSAVERYGNKAIHLQAAARYVINRKS